MKYLPRRVEQLPKIHLHCHLEGALRAQTFLELTERDGVSTRYRPGEPDVQGPRDVESVYRFADFREFLLTFAAVSRALTTPDDYARLAREFIEDANEQRVVYGELFVSPSVWSYFHPELDVREALAAINAELRRDGDERFALIMDVTRNFGAESAMKTVELAAQCGDRGVIGIGLGGDEARFPAELFAGVFAFARAHGLRCVAHAGEAAGAQSVRAAIDVLQAERIGHGVRALEDPAVVALLRDRQIPLEVCPTSNYLTGAAKREHPHPLHELDSSGVRLIVDADDPTLFGTTIGDEYLHVAERAGLDALERFIGNAVEVAFLAPDRKQVLRQRVSAELLALRQNETSDVWA